MNGRDEATIVHGFERAVRRHVGRTALVDESSGVTLDYDALAWRVQQAERVLARRGVRSGDVVAICAPNASATAAAMLAALTRGAAVLPLGPALTDHEWRALLTESGASVIVATTEALATARRMSARVVLALADLGDSGLDSTDGLAPARDDVTVSSNAPAFVCPSSGTTGPPKGVVLTHGQVVAACEQIAGRIAAHDRDVTLAVAPWFHILGLTAELLVPLMTGATVVTMPSFETTRFLDLLARHRVTYVAVPPPIAEVLAHDPSVAEHDLRALELVAVGGAPLLASVHTSLTRRLPACAVGQGWGLTETCGALCVPSRSDGARIGSVGRPLADTEIRVVDQVTGDPLPMDQDGELQARGPQIMKGYLGRPAETVAAFTADGWLHTGDLGHVDPDGNVVVAGRLKDLIKVNAFQVAPAEVEAALLAHPQVVDAAVVRRLDARAGERPVAFVQLAGPADLDDVLRLASTRLAPYKLPAEIHQVDSLPRTPSGKLLRRQLASD